MNTLDILLPFGLPPAELAGDLTRSLSAPSYATLLARSKSIAGRETDAFSRVLPHEQWLARQFGLAQEDPADSLPIAPAMMQGMGVAADDGFWFVLQPAHLHVARDHLVLTDVRKLGLSDAESRELFQSIVELFAESGTTLMYGDSSTWFLRADDWVGLSTATPMAASGHNIDIWMPRGSAERAWRRLLNEVQMTWHAHPVNTEREMHGHPAANSLWLWGGAQARPMAQGTRYDKTFNPPSWVRQAHDITDTVVNVTGVLGSGASSALVILDHLMDSAMASDWSNWLHGMQQLEREWMLPLLDALRNGKIAEVRFILSHNTKLLEVAAGKNSVKKFWIKPSLANLSR